MAPLAVDSRPAPARSRLVPAKDAGNLGRTPLRPGPVTRELAPCRITPGRGILQVFNCAAILRAPLVRVWKGLFVQHVFPTAQASVEEIADTLRAKRKRRFAS